MRLVGNLRDGGHARVESLLLAVHNGVKVGADEIARNCPRLLGVDVRLWGRDHGDGIIGNR